MIFKKNSIKLSDITKKMIKKHYDPSNTYRPKKSKFNKDYSRLIRLDRDVKLDNLIELSKIQSFKGGLLSVEKEIRALVRSDVGCFKIINDSCYEGCCCGGQTSFGYEECYECEKFTKKVNKILKKIKNMLEIYDKSDTIQEKQE